MIDWSRMIAPEVRAAGVLAGARETARAAVRDWTLAVTQRLTGDVPLTEMLAWSPKEAVARAWLADPKAAVPDLLAGEALVTGEDIAALSTRVVASAGAWRATQAMLTGLRRRADTALDAARTPEDVARALDAVMADADDAAARLGRG